MAKILITGGTGLIGNKLTQLLIERNHEVAILSRKPSEKNEFKWDIAKNTIDEKAFENIDFIIHLAGAGIADERWSNKRKKELIDSRVHSANLLFNYVKKRKIPLKGFISASGIGYYGAVTSEVVFEETAIAGNDFLAEICIKWEAAAMQFAKEQIPVTILRTGVVLSSNGGALEKMKTPIITPLGSGKQNLPWIHIDDLCEMYLKAIENNLTGIYNAVAPEHQTSYSFSKELAKSVQKPFVDFPVPSFVLKIMFGEMAIILLEGSRISAKKIEKTGFSFRFDTLEKALKSL
ncbi:TIGR01777 family oxidoreductase [Polaribacter gangjinensis]|uniref:TIGR01777 family protein n=1 Tax=Polaribacter gangjinensis TaxID=574710 RepID=A0A2S7W8A1_9FLAO|nr:TIGR01777 family oxidoreductase [Polaribacter gangjinensis]PQJ73860.1 TIGR01777 family protein [Polaribacter gangjinensis]